MDTYSDSGDKESTEICTNNSGDNIYIATV